MLVNKGTLAEIFINIKTTFNNAFTTADTTWQQIAMEVPSTTGQNDYAWLSTFPKMRKWIGEKYVKALEAFKYTIVNDDYESTIEVKKKDIEDDNLGIYAPQAKMIGDSAANLPDDIVYDLVNGVFTNLCYDGKPMCATDHKVKNVSVSNKGTAALSISTQAAAIASFGAGRTAMRKFKDEEGRSLNVSPNILLVGPALEDTANALMTTDRLEDGKVNLYKGACKVVVSPKITSDTAWFLVDARKSVKPIVYQNRKAPEFVQQTDPQSDDVFMKGVFRFGVEARAAGGYGFWQLIYGSTGAGN